MRDKIGTTSGPDRDQRPKLFSGEIQPSEAHGSDHMSTHAGSMCSQCCCCCCLRREAQQIIILILEAMLVYSKMLLSDNFRHWAVLIFRRGRRGGHTLFTHFFLLLTSLFQHLERHLLRSQRVIDQYWRNLNSRDILNFAPERVSSKHPPVTPSGSLVHPILIVRNVWRWRFFMKHFVHVLHFVRCSNQLLYARTRSTRDSCAPLARSKNKSQPTNKLHRQTFPITHKRPWCRHRTHKHSFIPFVCSFLHLKNAGF